MESFYGITAAQPHAAANKLNVSQPTVSYRTREERLGVSLFVRQRRQLVLTSGGRNTEEALCEIDNRDSAGH
ncbi:helix-turn-helix domain-containing protein [Sinorhizobium meliloti]|uniref:helix-turn-helix domain-containing protein n=1 Tax=Rhizobium meliloti TaxID=382 RepID=UPI0024A658B8|nr:LysR family transcriptional regulator [Sinorhizobium meliloti]